MADEMTRQEFVEYMAAFEHRLDGRFGQVDRRLDGIDVRLDRIDERLDRHDRRFDGLDERLDGHARRFDGLDTQLATHNNRFDRLDASFDDLKYSMTVQFEETRREVRFSLEAIDALRETSNSRFDRMSREQAEHKADLERAILHLRARTERIEDQVQPRDGG
jgi:chromosome segregation ATPase